MSRNIEALINPELLVWARETAGLIPEEAARKIGVPVEKLKLWEDGAQRPTVSQLRRVANTYKRPSAAFYLSKPPEIPEFPRDYRSIDSIEDREYSPALRLELRRARYRREVALELLEELDEKIVPFRESASIHDDPNILSKHIRTLLDISIEEQFHWGGDRYKALRSWKTAIEDLGVLVFQTTNTAGSQIELKHMRGLSISEEYFPIILLNSADSVNGRIFTLIHEFVHLLLHNGGICDLEDYHAPATDEERIEVFCNRVAGAVLVPEAKLLSQDIVARNGNTKTWSDYELDRLASRFSVSQEVILRRLLILNRTTEEFYKERREEFLERYKKWKASGSSGGPKYYRLVMRNNGLAYTKLVLQAYFQDCITIGEVSDYLGANVKHLRNIETEVMYGV